MALKEVPESGPVTPVVFRQNTRYGRRGEFGYLPSDFADLWIKKGVADLAIHYVTEIGSEHLLLESDEGYDDVVINKEGDYGKVDPDGEPRTLRSGIYDSFSE